MYDGDHKPGAPERVRAARAVELWAVLNVTPDSFSDGGKYLALDAAVARAREMIAQGADVIDVGGASSRPKGKTYGDGAEPVSTETEIARVVPVIEAIARETRVSIDTTSSVVASAAIDAGASIVNDVSMGHDPALLGVVAKRDATLVLMHTRGAGEVTPENTGYDDVVADVSRELSSACDRAMRAGVRRERLWIDPGLGFAKTAAQSAELLAHTDAIVALGWPVLIGASRKSFLGVLAERAGIRPGADGRLAASLAAAIVAARGGARALRVHDVAETRQALDVLQALNPSPQPSPLRGEGAGDLPRPEGERAGERGDRPDRRRDHA